MGVVLALVKQMASGLGAHPLVNVSVVTCHHSKQNSILVLSSYIDISLLAVVE